MHVMHRYNAPKRDLPFELRKSRNTLVNSANLRIHKLQQTLKCFKLNVNHADVHLRNEIKKLNRKSELIAFCPLACSLPQRLRRRSSFPRIYRERRKRDISDAANYSFAYHSRIFANKYSISDGGRLGRAIRLTRKRRFRS